MKKETLIIGVGNTYRRDDGLGVYAARQLGKKKPEHAEILERSGEGTELMDAWEGYQRVILIDAVCSGERAGTIHRLDASRETIPARFFHYSTHAFSVAEAVEMARALGRLPGELLIFGVEGEDYSSGEGLSEKVQTAVQTVIREVESSCMN